jgi:hypothetical protein
MARGRLRFRQKDVVRAVKAVKAAGIEVGRIEISPDGTITIRPGKPVSMTDTKVNEWDDI